MCFIIEMISFAKFRLKPTLHDSDPVQDQITNREPVQIRGMCVYMAETSIL